MFLAAGQIIPSITGKTWDDFIRDRIFTPLGMKSSSTSIKAFATSANVATPHSKINDKIQAVSWRNIDNIAPAGSINSNVQDMAQWVRLQLGRRRLSKSTSAQRCFDQRDANAADDRSSRRSARVSIPKRTFLLTAWDGFSVTTAARKLVEHGGAIDGMRAEVAMIPEEKLGLVILTNLNGNVLPHALMYKIFDFYLNAPQRDWSADC